MSKNEERSATALRGAVKREAARIAASELRDGTVLRFHHVGTAPGGRGSGYTYTAIWISATRRWYTSGGVAPVGGSPLVPKMVEQEEMVRLLSGPLVDRAMVAVGWRTVR